MKKLDLHIHTVSTASDHAFSFSLSSLRRYVEDNCIDGIAITNHNKFDLEQFIQIRNSLSIIVFPGIEIDIENGHLLVIADTDNIEDFSGRCSRISAIFEDSHRKSISEDEFLTVFTEPQEYLLIPHYDKSPSVSFFTIPNLTTYITCGEVSSAKKFITMKKNTEEIVPVLFGDIRASDPIVEPQNRQTYIDINEITLSAIKYSLTDREKVSLSADDGHKLFEVLELLY